MSAEATVAFETLAGNTIITGKQWWHLRETVVMLTPEQVEHFQSEGMRYMRDYTSITRVALGRIIFSQYCVCDRAAIQIQLDGYADSAIKGFAPRLRKTAYGCSRCGAIA